MQEKAVFLGPICFGKVRKIIISSILIWLQNQRSGTIKLFLFYGAEEGCRAG